MKQFFVFLFSFFFFAASFVTAQTKRNLTIDDLYALRGVSQPQVSPDAKWIAYVVRTYDQKTDKSNRDVYMIPYAGGDAIQLTTSEKSDTHPRWSPDNKYLAFLSGRNKKDQVFLLNREGGEAVQLTDVKQGVSDFSWSPDGKRLALIIQDQDPDEPADDAKDTSPKPIVLKRLQFLFDEYGY